MSLVLVVNTFFFYMDSRNPVAVWKRKGRKKVLISLILSHVLASLHTHKNRFFFSLKKLQIKKTYVSKTDAELSGNKN